ncbi:MAG: Type II secretion system protein E [Cenarchaeum symbiont of Oopsacas minuta]|nr:Type II secretion system protein E [Cenarchaeum symbiont of Oopsacas minuta]
MTDAVFDTSAVINGQMLKLAESGSLKDSRVIILTAVMDELISQASSKKESGSKGLEQIDKLREGTNRFCLKVVFEGRHPNTEEIGLAGRGRIDTLIRDGAKEHNAILYTSDRIQHMAAKAQGVLSELLLEKQSGEMEFLKYFDKQTMSIHLKEGMAPLAKMGKPGEFELVHIGKVNLTKKDIMNIISQILSSPQIAESGTEISKRGAIVVQYMDYRVAFTRPPLSEKCELTIVHPTVTMTLEEYNLSEKLMERLADSAEGVVVAGSPGSGKSTFASALANFYHSKNRIVKTFESPRDLKVKDGVTQYAKLDGSFENTADILLLVRPDYTIFDEVRRYEDFKVFSDLRLAGVGMVGVVHANTPIDSIQRFVGKIELGIIPHVIDTVVFVKDGKIQNVYSLTMSVKVPSGMTEQDLARPVVQISDFETGTPRYEIYTFGEENVVMPVSETAETGTAVDRLAEKAVLDAILRYDPSARVSIVSPGRARVNVSSQHMARIIGRSGSNVMHLERTLGIKLDIQKHEDSGNRYDTPYDDGDFDSGTEKVPFSLEEIRKSLMIKVGREYAGGWADIYVDGELTATSRVGPKGNIKLSKKRHIYKEIAHSRDLDLTISIRDR